jgi:protein-S-isoprenylcysteine O-methyltransferase Ste14
MLKDEGPEIGFSGAYTEVTPPTRLVYTRVYEPMKAIGAVLVTVTFDDHDGKTHLVSRSLCPSKQVRDGMLASGMYRWIRHPIYTAMLTMFLGTAIACGQYHALLGVAILFVPI